MKRLFKILGAIACNSSVIINFIACSSSDSLTTPATKSLHLSKLDININMENVELINWRLSNTLMILKEDSSQQAFVFDVNANNKLTSLNQKNW
ncbi:hypothetical protein [Spiroplasma endosymbiont of Eupeodes luniger]|uniref:hypothetical protein n=1 Tax=Spiroplasma endosymbiont of Eupeodes luniger TaxID=3066300 RepID=UPI0030D0A686